MKPVNRCKVVVNRLRSNTRKYFSETTLHGFRYITDPKSSKFKSYFWTLVCLVSTCLCIILIFSQFRSYYSNRITTTILTTAFPIWEVPFPAVTICNFNLVYKSRTKTIKKYLMKYASSDEIDNFFSNLSTLVLSNKVEEDVEWTDHNHVARLLEYAGYTSEKLMSMLAHPCTTMISDCYWNNKQKNCSDIFHLTKTNRGYCCSFNYRAIKNRHLNMEKEYYVTGVGPSYGLSVHLNAEEEQYLSPLKQSLGIDISIHENIQYPDMSIYTTTVRPGNDVSLSVKPEITQSEEGVKGTEISTRGCAFADEIKMAWTKSYSYTTCINECKAKVIKELCKCVPFYYYPVAGTTKYCTLPDMACIRRNNIKFKSSKVAYSHFRGTRKASMDTLKCKCYPPCNEISYTYQQDHQPLKISESEKITNDSVLHVYFGHVSCMKLLRSVLITWELILASVGGLIGLCLGGSILSIIEFLYNLIETLFSRYKKIPKEEGKPREYQQKLYLTDFKNYRKRKITEVSHFKIKNLKNN